MKLYFFISSIFLLFFTSQANATKEIITDDIKSMGMVTDSSAQEDKNLVLMGQKNYLLKPTSKTYLTNHDFFLDLYNIFPSNEIVFGDNGLLNFGTFRYDQKNKENYKLKVTISKEKDTLNQEQSFFLEKYKFTCKINKSSNVFLESCSIKLPIEMKILTSLPSTQLKTISNNSVKTVHFKVKDVPFSFLNDAPTAVVLPVAIPLMIGLCAASHITGETKRGEHCRFPFG